MPLAQWEWDVHIMMEELATSAERIELLEKAKQYGPNLIDMEYWKELVRVRNARGEQAAAYSVEPNAYQAPEAPSTESPVAEPLAPSVETPLPGVTPPPGT